MKQHLTTAITAAAFCLAPLASASVFTFVEDFEPVSGGNPDGLVPGTAGPPIMIGKMASSIAITAGSSVKQSAASTRISASATFPRSARAARWTACRTSA